MGVLRLGTVLKARYSNEFYGVLNISIDVETNKVTYLLGGSDLNKTMIDEDFLRDNFLIVDSSGYSEIICGMRKEETIVDFSNDKELLL